MARSVAAAKLTGTERVLEIGAGSGYQAAVLAECARRVYTIERIPTLATRARKLLEEMGYGNVVVRLADGTEGWKDQAPFDAILVAAAAPSIPQPLVDQLKDGGRLIIPLNAAGRDGQVLTVVERRGSEVDSTPLDDVVFVPLIGRHGHDGDA
ncbi:MAG TPA: protein-L-isoaspartate O-methyltransferase [bacterium]|nr:protein-L-isoaspartate O-methyltransferase [bacterium]